jgi:hypothetical protein
LAGFFVHFFLIIISALGEMAWFVANGYTALPAATENYGKRVQWLTDAVAGRTLQPSNPIRQTLIAYLHCVGADGGYAFFAPSVPNSYKVVFEIHYPNGDIDYELPHIIRSAAAVRLATLLHYIGRANHDSLREVMLKMLTYPIAREHPTATTIRTIFGYIAEPTAAEASKGKRESYNVLYAYDFNLSPAREQEPAP